MIQIGVQQLMLSSLTGSDEALLETLKRIKEYGFDYNKYTDMKSLIFDINNYLEEVEDEQLENILYELSEFDYYHNTNK